MITGDQSPTAHAVAQKLNLSQGERLEILDSTEFTAIDPEVMGALAQKVHVYSRVSPAHKLRIVQALQRAGTVVAMTGDGVNDGPALKAADIGIAMGKSGTDVAREVADVVLADDELETLVIAVRDGRTTYQNIRKSVHFFLSTNLSEIMVMFAAMAAGIGFPLNVMQLLWINIISDIFPGLALSLEAPEADVLDQPPRDPGEPLFSGEDYRRMAWESAVISGASLTAYGMGVMQYGLGPRAGSIAFQSLTTAQLLHALSCRSERHTLFDRGKLPPNRALDLALGGSLAVQALTLVLPGLRRLLGLTPMNLVDMAVVGGSSILPLLINEITKLKKEDL
jgi:Ca2+-transporting ATPase